MLSIFEFIIVASAGHRTMLAGGAGVDKIGYDEFGASSWFAWNPPFFCPGFDDTPCTVLAKSRSKERQNRMLPFYRCCILHSHLTLTFPCPVFSFLCIIYVT